MRNAAHRRQWLIRSTALALGLLLAAPWHAAPSLAAPAAPTAPLKAIRIKNARTVRVVLGDRREPAAGLRADKAGWTVLLAPELAATSADLVDITPGVAGSRWSVPVSLGKLLLDPERFLPSHVYRVELRRDGQLLGGTLIYLHPPPAESVARVRFEEDKASDEDSSSLAPTPKGELSRGGSAGRTKPAR